MSNTLPTQPIDYTPTLESLARGGADYAYVRAFFEGHRDLFRAATGGSMTDFVDELDGHVASGGRRYVIPTNLTPDPIWARCRAIARTAASGERKRIAASRERRAAELAALEASFALPTFEG